MSRATFLTWCFVAPCLSLLACCSSQAVMDARPYAGDVDVSGYVGVDTFINLEGVIGLPDKSKVVSKFQVEDSFTVKAVEVHLSGLHHTYLGDLQIDVSFNGRRVYLNRKRVGSQASRDLGGDYVWTDDAQTTLWEAEGSPSSVGSGSYLPELDSGPLSQVFGAQDAKGTWEVEMEDFMDADDGVVSQLSLVLFDQEGKRLTYFNKMETSLPMIPHEDCGKLYQVNSDGTIGGVIERAGEKVSHPSHQLVAFRALSIQKCHFQFDFTVSNLHSNRGTVAIQVACGNGLLDSGEECDDTNFTSGDGCDNRCKIEKDFACEGEPSLCQSCANGSVEGTEECDDGNDLPGDGCSSDCAIESGYTCFGRPLSECFRCGDGAQEGIEECDDGNDVGSDGCDSSCHVEIGWNCAGDAGGPSTCSECGDGVRLFKEECDDGNTRAGDGCSSTCTEEAGWHCGGLPDRCWKCGDGHVDIEVEFCDDGNNEDLDGCDSECAVEQGWRCLGDPSVCSRCGDGVVQGDEQCDDRNDVDGDGCTSDCLLEKYWTCDKMEVPSVCSRCGDGFIQEGEECDDGNNDNGDGCGDTCYVEKKGGLWTCRGEPSICAKCGDNIRAEIESCDDGNTKDGDGCDTHCRIEEGWTCQGRPSECWKCGDGKVTTEEECDDGNTTSGDGCNSICLIEGSWHCDGESPTKCSLCGNGLLEGVEDCDDGNTAAGDGCSSFCSVEYGYACSVPEDGGASICMSGCGDGKKTHIEDCDDANNEDGDGCDATCKIEQGWSCDGSLSSVCVEKCGDSWVVGRETCDDGNRKDGDGCSRFCSIEVGWVCSDAPSRCSLCGNGRVDDDEGEECDDGNQTAGDGCSESCHFEGGNDYNCTLVGSYCGYFSPSDSRSRPVSTHHHDVTDTCFSFANIPLGSIVGGPCAHQGVRGDEGYIPIEGAGQHSCVHEQSRCDRKDNWTCYRDSSGGVVCVPNCDDVPEDELCPPVCGDGRVDGYEECDAGMGSVDGPDCTSSCLIPQPSPSQMVSDSNSTSTTVAIIGLGVGCFVAGSVALAVYSRRRKIQRLKHLVDDTQDRFVASLLNSPATRSHLTIKSLSPRHRGLLQNSKGPTSGGHFLDDTASHKALSWSCLKGHFNLVKFLLDEGQNPCGIGEDGQTPLHLAAVAGNYDICELLLERGVSMDARNKAGRTALHITASSGSVPIAKALIGEGASLDCSDNRGNTPLHLAVIEGDIDMTRVLVDHGCRLDLKDDQGRTSIHWAALGFLERQETLELLQEQFALRPDKETEKALESYHSLQRSSQHLSIAEFLVKRGADLGCQDNHGYCAMHICALSGHFCDVFFVDVKSHASSESGDETTQSSLFSTSHRNIPAIANALKSHDEHSPMRVKTVATIDTPDSQGRTPLVIAANLGHVALVEHLLERGARVNHRDSKGFSALHHASFRNHVVVVRALLKHRAGLEIGDAEDGATAGHWAARAGSIDCLQSLLDHGASVNQVDEDGDSLLHWGSAWPDIVALLLDRGADVSLTNKNGESPLHVAAHFTYFESLRILGEHAGDSGHIFSIISPFLTRSRHGHEDDPPSSQALLESTPSPREANTIRSLASELAEESAPSPMSEQQNSPVPGPGGKDPPRKKKLRVRVSDGTRKAPTAGVNVNILRSPLRKRFIRPSAVTSRFTYFAFRLYQREHSMSVTPHLPSVPQSTRSNGKEETGAKIPTESEHSVIRLPKRSNPSAVIIEAEGTPSTPVQTSSDRKGKERNRSKRPTPRDVVEMRIDSHPSSGPSRPKTNEFAERPNMPLPKRLTPARSPQSLALISPPRLSSHKD